MMDDGMQYRHVMMMDVGMQYGHVMMELKACNMELRQYCYHYQLILVASVFSRDIPPLPPSTAAENGGLM